MHYNLQILTYSISCVCYNDSLWNFRIPSSVPARAHYIIASALAWLILCFVAESVLAKDERDFLDEERNDCAAVNYVVFLLGIAAGSNLAPALQMCLDSRHGSCSY